MKIMFFARKHRRFTLPIFLTNLFFSLHFAATLYVGSSYLENFFSTRIVSLLFILGAIGNIILFLLSPYLLRLLGNRRFLFSLIVVDIVTTLGLTFSNSSLPVALFFIIRGSILMLIYYSLDIFLEEVSENKSTGRIRGFYLTIMNLAISIAPLLIAYFAFGNNYRTLYFVSTLILIPPLLLSAFSFHNKNVHPHHTQKRTLPFASFIRSKNIWKGTLCAFVLEFFFAFMVVYTPLYLHEYIRFSWQQIGVIFTIMLLPFVLFEWPVGKLADTKYGEKEIMSLGFFLMGLALIFMPFLGHTVVYWTMVLFLSRVGASFVEVTTESYFFKHVDSRDIGFINIYRLVRPIALILAPIIGVLAINVFSFTASFLVIAIIVFWGLKQSLHLKDTR